MAPHPAPVSLIVTDAASVLDVLADLDVCPLVVSFTDPGSPPPDVRSIRPDVELLHFAVVDATMSDEDWIGRFGGEPVELFQPGDAERLAAAAPALADGTVLIHCGQGVSRSTAAAILLAASVLDPDAAIEAAVAAQRASFVWREPCGFLPNERIVAIGSVHRFGDRRLLDALERRRHRASTTYTRRLGQCDRVLHSQG